MTILALTTGLTYELTLALGLLGDGLTIGNLRTTDLGADFELTQQAVDDDLEVELSHARR